MRAREVIAAEVWEQTLRAVLSASQVTLGVLHGSVTSDDAAILLLCDVVVAAEDADLLFSRRLPPPAVVAGRDFAAWLSPQPWDSYRLMELGLVTDVVLDSEVESWSEEWATAVERWDHGTLYESRALFRTAHRGLVDAVTFWSQARSRTAVGD